MNSQIIVLSERSQMEDTFPCSIYKNCLENKKTTVLGNGAKCVWKWSGFRKECKKRIMKVHEESLSDK